ncbi:MAG: hypothetical protein ACYDIE_07135 [Candidatus Krumholzibacteriia bacterium]
MKNWRSAARLAAISLTLLTCAAGRAAADPAALPSLARADWLLDHLAATPGLAGPGGLSALDQPNETGGVGGGSAVTATDDGGRRGAALPMLMSAVVPGLGEAYLGHKRGYALMAIDVASWIGVAHYTNAGNRKRDEYYAYADAHWTEARLAAAYGDVSLPGTFYFPGVTDYTALPLWVSVAADRREYYENLGKWDQFVFGWDDFLDPRDFLVQSEYTSQDLQDPRVSTNRETYRAMREDSNRQFTNRDRLLYLNMATRLFSIFEVAYLQGLLGGGPKDQLAIAGHPVTLIAEPVGLSSSRLGVSVAY